MPRPDSGEGTQPLTPAALQILLALAEGERHGYAIMQAVATRPGGARLGAATLYRTLAQLLAAGLIAEIGERLVAGGERRRHYRLTAAGGAAATAETERLRRLVSWADETRARGFRVAPEGGF